MKFANRIRMHAMLVGLGTSLLLANATYAQQDTEPTTFDVNPGVAPAQTAAAAPAGVNTVVMTPAQSEDTRPATATKEQAVVEEADARTWTEVDTLTLMALLLCVGSAIAHGVSKTRRDRSSQIPA
jgi:hypothetical protein